MPKVRKPRKGPRVERIKRIPVTGLRDQIGLEMHAALAGLRFSPNGASFDRLAGIFNLMQLALEDDAAHSHEATFVTAGAAALVNIEDKAGREIALELAEIEPIQLAVTAIDRVIGKMHKAQLYNANLKLDAISKQEMEKA